MKTLWIKGLCLVGWAATLGAATAGEALAGEALASEEDSGYPMTVLDQSLTVLVGRQGVWRIVDAAGQIRHEWPSLEGEQEHSAATGRALWLAVPGRLLAVDPKTGARQTWPLAECQEVESLASSANGQWAVVVCPKVVYRVQRGAIQGSAVATTRSRDYRQGGAIVLKVGDDGSAALSGQGWGAVLQVSGQWVDQPALGNCITVADRGQEFWTDASLFIPEEFRSRGASSPQSAAPAVSHWRMNAGKLEQIGQFPGKPPCWAPAAGPAVCLGDAGEAHLPRAKRLVSGAWMSAHPSGIHLKQGETTRLVPWAEPAKWQHYAAPAGTATSPSRARTAILWQGQGVTVHGNAHEVVDRLPALPKELRALGVADDGTVRALAEDCSAYRGRAGAWQIEAAGSADCDAETRHRWIDGPGLWQWLPTEPPRQLRMVLGAAPSLSVAVDPDLRWAVVPGQGCTQAKAFSGDGNRLAQLREDGRLCLYATATGLAEHCTATGDGGDDATLLWSIDHQAVAVAGRQFKIYRAATAQLLKLIHRPRTSLNIKAFQGDQAILDAPDAEPLGIDLAAGQPLRADQLSAPLRKVLRAAQDQRSRELEDDHDVATRKRDADEVVLERLQSQLSRLGQRPVDRQSEFETRGQWAVESSRVRVRIWHARSLALVVDAEAAEAQLDPTGRFAVLEGDQGSLWRLSTAPRTGSLWLGTRLASTEPLLCGLDSPLLLSGGAAVLAGDGEQREWRIALTAPGGRQQVGGRRQEVSPKAHYAVLEGRGDAALVVVDLRTGQAVPVRALAKASSIEINDLGQVLQTNRRGLRWTDLPRQLDRQMPWPIQRQGDAQAVLGQDGSVYFWTGRRGEGQAWILDSTGSRWVELARPRAGTLPQRSPAEAIGQVWLFAEDGLVFAQETGRLVWHCDGALHGVGPGAACLSSDGVTWFSAVTAKELGTTRMPAAGNAAPHWQPAVGVGAVTR